MAIDYAKLMAEHTVVEAGFEIEPEGRRVRGEMRRFAARPSPMATADL